MKDDTVSRAAVMQSLTREYDRRRTGDGLKLAWIEKAVNEVPAVQTCEDAVSRQQAIDALCNDLCSGHHDCKHYPDCENLKAIQALPAVETEVLKCKDCYWWTKQSDSLQGRCDRYGFYPTGYWYCAAARERRTDDQT